MHYFKKFVNSILGFFILILLNGMTATSYAEIPTGKVLFTVPYYATNPPEDLFTPVAHSKGRTFLTWVDTANRPWVTMYFNGNVTTVPLDNNPDYTAFPDGHHRFSMGIDKKGYLHITGDMHYYPAVPDGNTRPARYLNQTILYWVSNQPYTNAGGFHFAGGANASTAIPGTGWVFGRFFVDKHGELYYSSMARAYDPGNGTFLQGMGALGLYHYNVDTQTWTALGGYADAVTPPGTKYYKVLFWENSGYAPDGWFQNYSSTFKFDNNNTLHVAVSVDSSTQYALNDRLFYAASTDSGLTWKKANGTPIPGLPLRAVDSSPNEADLIYDTKGTVGLPVYADVVADQAGNVAVLGDVWRRWNGTAWVNDIANSQSVWGGRGLLGPDGKLTFLEGDTIYLRRLHTFTQNNSSYNVQALFPSANLHTLQGISDLGLQTTGSFFGVAINDTGAGLLNVVQIDLQNNSLPAPWSDTDIGTNITYGGAADFSNNNSVVLRGSGTGVASNIDNLHYVYRTLTGNGSITARVAAADTLVPTSGLAVMMRESLGNNASLVAVDENLSSNGLALISRNGTNTAANFTNLTLNPTPQWLRVTRVGNVFTGYYSSDGVTWKQFGNPVTIAMANQIYVGLTAWSGISSLYTGTLDNISVNGLS